MIADVVGYALLPFIISIVFSCTKCGERKIHAGTDILGFLMAIGVYVGAQVVLGPVIAGSGLPAMVSSLASAVSGYALVAIIMPLVYGVFYSKLPPAAQHH